MTSITTMVTATLTTSWVTLAIASLSVALALGPHRAPRAGPSTRDKA
jgi:hypothetical protein